jgi:hypothetical protein
MHDRSTFELRTRIPGVNFFQRSGVEHGHMPPREHDHRVIQTDRVQILAREEPLFCDKVLEVERSAGDHPLAFWRGGGFFPQRTTDALQTRVRRRMNRDHVRRCGRGHFHVAMRVHETRHDTATSGIENPDPAGSRTNVGGGAYHDETTSAHQRGFCARPCTVEGHDLGVDESEIAAVRSLAYGRRGSATSLSQRRCCA